MFKFGFSTDQNTPEQEDNKENTDKDKDWLPSEEITIGNNIVPVELLDKDNNYLNQIELEDKYVIRHVSSEIVMELIQQKQDDNDSILKADQIHSDLLTAVYEGGLKIWQCTYDLLNFIYSEEMNFSGKNVLDLGCGAGILGIYAYLQGANVYFQDYNPEVLKCITIPNVLLNKRADDNLKGVHFYSGDWNSFVNITAPDFDKEDKKFDVILTSETIYNCANYEKLNELFKSMLKKTGVIYLAAKVYYFGVGGGIRSFLDMIDADDVFDSKRTWKNAEGVQREIITLKFK